MATGNLSRRNFARVVGAAVGAALVLPKFGRAIAEARDRPRPGGGFIQLDSNENPYGPSPRAMDAMTTAERVASRYPDAQASRVTAASDAAPKSSAPIWWNCRSLPACGRSARNIGP